MDIAASMAEVKLKKPGITPWELVHSGFTVGRHGVIGTMATTLLLAYSGGYLTLLMIFQVKVPSIMPHAESENRGGGDYAHPGWLHRPGADGSITALVGGVIISGPYAYNRSAFTPEKQGGLPTGSGSEREI